MGRTSSRWGSPPRRYYRFLSRVEQEVHGRQPKLLVVGCADGKFVLPAARRDWRVVGIDLDPRMIEGCEPSPDSGLPTAVPGLKARLSHEGLAGRVDVRLGDYMDERDLGPCDAVWTSGSLQYSTNLRYTAAALTDRLRTLLKPGGLTYIEYMIPDEPRLKGRPNCPPVSWWKKKFPLRGWEVLYHRCYYRREDLPHPYVPRLHFHSWGRLLARRERVS